MEQNVKVKHRPNAQVFEVDGRGGATYIVVIGAGVGGRSCTCPAGQHGVKCRHVDEARRRMPDREAEQIEAAVARHGADAS